MKTIIKARRRGDSDEWEARLAGRLEWLPQWQWESAAKAAGGDHAAALAVLRSWFREPGEADAVAVRQDAAGEISAHAITPGRRGAGRDLDEGRGRRHHRRPAP